MRNEDNDCIRYLMKEMDPSEEILMERAMMEDEDLLIEVESMRQTLKKLDKLPEVEPPSDVQESILDKAAEHAEKKRKSNKKIRPAFKYAVAATLALTVTAGGAWFYIGSEGERAQQSSSQPAAQAQVSTAPTSDMQVENGNVQNVSSEENNIEPWVDRNNILNFEDHFLNRSSNFEALMNNSTRKLQLIDTPSMGNQRVKSLQLTGSGN